MGSASILLLSTATSTSPAVTSSFFTSLETPSFFVSIVSTCASLTSPTLSFFALMPTSDFTLSGSSAAPSAVIEGERESLTPSLDFLPAFPFRALTFTSTLLALSPALKIFALAASRCFSASLVKARRRSVAALTLAISFSMRAICSSSLLHRSEDSNGSSASIFSQLFSTNGFPLLSSNGISPAAARNASAIPSRPEGSMLVPGPNRGPLKFLSSIDLRRRKDFTIFSARPFLFRTSFELIFFSAAKSLFLALRSKSLKLFS
mmetsp:Transcript_17214/g.24352  ORF Transcript_17214/g.24352 Transcript_17214/m.24352 type:complete len:263 (+) Transcript_17214:107-895(+)